MNHTIFSRGTRTQMEGWNLFNAAPSLPGLTRQWCYMMRKTQLKQEEDGTLTIKYQHDPYSSRAQELFKLNKEACDKYKSRALSLDMITGAPRHLSLYLTLVEHGLFDSFINKYTEVFNAANQPA